MKDESNSLILAMVLSFIAIYTVNFFFKANEPHTELTPQIEQVVNTPSETAIKQVVNTPKYSTTEEAINADTRINFKNSSISGSIRLKGSRFDNLLLEKYTTSIEENSPKVELFAPQNTKNDYFAELGWLSLDRSIDLPLSTDMWSTESDMLTPNSPAILTWDNGNGIKITRKISLDENYLFTITDKIENNSGNELEIFPYALISRNISEKQLSRSVVHEGVSGIVDGNLKEIKYNKIDERGRDSFDTKSGWFGFSDRYWFSAIILDGKEKSKVTIKNNGNDNYQLDYLGNRLNIAPGKSVEHSYKLYSGAKEIKLLDKYTKEGIKKFDLAVDFGWYYFLTKPFFYILDLLYGLLGNMGWAILLFAALLRLLMFPVANKSFANMAKIKALQPKIMDIKDKYGDNQMLIQQATMELYKREKVNPASGCLPMLIQIPVFFSLYKVLNIAIEIRQAPFVGWIKDLSAPDPMTISAMTGLSFIPQFLDIGVWPMLMGLTMFVQQKLNPAPTNKDQAKMFALMPIFFTFMMGHFASGLIIYWTLSNILSIIQQKAIMKKNGVK